MHKFWQVFSHEIVTLVGRPSYWLGAVGIPLLAFLLYGGVNLLNSRAPAGEEGVLSMSMLQSSGTMQSLESIGELINPSEDTNLPLGFVDLAGVTSLVPPAVKQSDYLRFPSLAAAQQALDQGQVRAFYLFPLDFIHSGQVLYYASNLSISRAVLLDRGLDYWVKYNLLNGSDEKLAAASQPLGEIHERNLDPANAPRFSIFEMDSYFVMIGILGFLTMLLGGSAGMIFSSFNRESSNRVMEVLLVSTSSEQILWGKFSALALVGLAQMGLWLGGASLFGVQMGTTFSVSSLSAITPAFFGWALLFVGLAFLLYGTLMMGVSTFFPFLREASHLLTAMILPLMMPIMLLLVFSETPNHPVLVIFSLFPLTAPTMILLRMLMTDVPLWQALLSAALLLASALAVIRFVARHFRPAHLLSARSFFTFNVVRGRQRRPRTTLF